MTGRINTNLHKNAEIAKAQIDSSSEIEKLKTEGGLLGAIFGRGSEKPNNIAVFVIFLGAIFLICGIFLMSNDDIYRKVVIALSSSFITIAIGFVFGAASHR